MMRCCKHCGALLEDEAKVCDFCGAILEVPAPVEPAPQPIETAVATEALPEPTPKKKIPKKKWFIFGGIVLAVIAIAVAVNMLFFSPHTAVRRYETVINGEFDELKSLAPQEYWDYVAESSGKTVEQYIETLVKNRKESYLAQTSNEDSFYGKFLSTKIQVLDTEEISAAELSGIKDTLDEMYGIDASRVGSAYRLCLKITSKYSKESSSLAGTTTAIKIGSKWYLIRSTRIGNDKFRVTFLASAHLYELYTFY